jgi:DNA-binding NarL/FixJ family response regulator
MVRVGIVDDHPVVVEGIAARLAEAGFALLAPVVSVEAIDWRPAPDVVLCDLRLPGMSGGRAVGLLAARGWPVLAMSGTGLRHAVLTAIGAGARGFVDKAAPPSMFVDAVSSVAAGGFHVSAELAGYLLDSARARPLLDDELTQPERDLLLAIAEGDRPAEATWLHRRIFDAEVRRQAMYRPTPREREVIGLVGGEHLTHRQVARRLRISPHTVPDHLRSIKAKYLAGHPDEAASLTPAAVCQRWFIELSGAAGALD